MNRLLENNSDKQNNTKKRAKEIFRISRRRQNKYIRENEIRYIGM